MENIFLSIEGTVRDHPDIVTLKLPNMQLSCRVHLNITRTTHLYNNLPQSSSRTLSKTQNTQIKRQTYLTRLLPCLICLCLWPPAYFLPILLHRLFSFCHILLWIPHVILPIPTLQFYIVCPTSCIRASSEIMELIWWRTVYLWGVSTRGAVVAAKWPSDYLCGQLLPCGH